MIDLDGVLYVGSEVIPGAIECLQWLEDHGLKLRFLTNTTTRTAHEVADKLASLGFHVDESHIFSAVTATSSYLSSRATEGRLPSVHLVVRQSILTDFPGFPHASLETGDDAPDFVVLGDIGAAWSYPLLNTIFNEMMNGAELVAMHRNKYWRTAEGLRMDIGAFVAGLEYVSGRSATVIGKPAEQFFDQAIRSLGLPADQVAMIGDDIEMDVGGGQQAGLMGLLVRTGKYRADFAAESEIAPDAELDSIADLPQWLSRVS